MVKWSLTNRYNWLESNDDAKGTKHDCFLDSHTWMWNTISSALPSHICSTLHKLKLKNDGKEDYRKWLPDPKGKFFIKSAWNAVR